MSSMWGKNVRISLFGESHGAAVGVTVDGLPAGEKIDVAELKRFTDRRRPGKALTTPRVETDEAEILSGLKDGVTEGSPLTAIIRNTNTHSADYADVQTLPRPGHADFTAQVKYGGFQDVRGGGHFSARVTAGLVLAGGICKQILSRRGIEIYSHVASVGGVTDDPLASADATKLQRLAKTDFPVLNEAVGRQMKQTVEEARKREDSVGGTVECGVYGLPAGIGSPMFDGVENRIASLTFGIPAVKGIEFGEGFRAATLYGSENNDAFTVENGKIRTVSNHAGGILGGISTGMPILFRVAFKPTPSIGIPQQSVNFNTLQTETLVVRGRHDPCVVLRAFACVEAAAAIAVLDLLKD